MSPRRTRTVHGPQTWARVREAYAAGMTGGEIERVYGVKPGALRQRAFREGWSRTAVARAAEAASKPVAPPPAPHPEAPPPDPAVVLASTLALAAAHLAAGREAQAEAALRRGEALARLAETAARLRPRTLDDLKAARHEIWLTCVRLAKEAAHRALTDPHDLAGPLGEWAYLWRAQNLHPDCAAADAARRKAFGR